MHVHPTAVIHDCSRTAERADHLLQLFHLTVFQLRGIHFHTVPPVVCGSLPPAFPARGLDAAVIHEPPFFPRVVNDFPRVVGMGFMRLTGRCPEQGRHGLGGLFAGDPCHFQFTPEILVL